MRRQVFPYDRGEFPMENPVDKTLYQDNQGVDGKEMPGGGPHGAGVGAPRSRDRVITSSGEAPTGGTPVGGASDRVIPGKAVRDMATNDNVGPGALELADTEEDDGYSGDGGDPRSFDRSAGGRVSTRK